MIRYRCPNCAALIVAHERRAGQSSVCKACVKPHPIPADPSLWLTESGEPLHPPAVAAPEPIAVVPVPVPEGLAPTAFDIQLPELAAPEPAKPAPRATRPVPAASAHAQPDAGTVATVTPPPRGRPLPATAPAPRGGRFAQTSAPVPQRARPAGRSRCH